MDGLELVEAIRRDHPGLPVILMTAHGSEETAIQALRKGATNYVAKRNLAERARRHREQRARDRARGSRPAADPELPHPDRVALRARQRRARTSRRCSSQLEVGVTRMHLCDRTGWMRIAVALREALVNAIYHGNLELTSQLLRGRRVRVRSAGRAASGARAPSPGGAST